MQKDIATVVSHTHWDRAWYVPFQAFRIRLVEHLDRLLGLLEADSHFCCFMLDGQMSLLDDYLEIRPMNRGRLRRLVQAGRLQVGPWYVLPDEYLEGPEAMVRNLMLGHRRAEVMGVVMKVGYTPDAFGHIAQLPQILAGFGIDNVVFWRGMGPEGEELGSEFVWSALDGTEALAIWMAKSYSNASFVGYPRGWGRFAPDDFDMEKALVDLKRAVEDLKPTSHSGALLLMNGVDHMPPQEEIPEVVRGANSVLAHTEVRHGTLLDHIGRVRAADVWLPRWTGEFNRGYYHVILGGVYSARMPLKQANYQAERLLVHYAEPMSALAWLTAGTSDWQSFLWEAWRYVLQNHPHDDICGCSVDETHIDDDYRFKQAVEIGEAVTRESLRALGEQVDTASQEGVPILVCNSLGCGRGEMLSADLFFEQDEDWCHSFRIVDDTGEPVEHQVLADEDAYWSEPLQHHSGRRVTVTVPVEVPACGYRTYYVQPAQPSRSTERTTAVRAGDRSAENELVAFEIAADGSLTLRDKRTGLVYEGLNRFEDTEDAGDEYSYSPAPRTQTIRSDGLSARVTRLHAGPLQATFRVDVALAVPERLTKDLEGRVEERVALPISTWIALYADQPGLYLRTTLDNRARDHRLRALFPTPHTPRAAHVDGHFAVLERDIDLPCSEGWVEGPIPTQHQRGFVAVDGSEGGMALLNRGLPEYEARREEDGTVTLCLTLLRSVGVLGRGSLLTRRTPGAHIPLATPDAQCLGEHTFEYALLPYEGGWQAALPALASYSVPLYAARIPRQRGTYPSTHSFVTLMPDQFVLSTVKRSEAGEGLIVRGYNATGDALEVVLHVGFPVQAVYLTNLNEERTDELHPDAQGNVTLSVRGHEIVTMEIVPR